MGQKIKLQTFVRITTSLQIFHRMWRWEKIENRSVFGEDMDKS